MKPEFTPLSTEQAKARRGRNIALGLILAGLVFLFFVVTLVRLGGHVADRPL